ncbi:MAG: response regulator transcription factor [Ignavibacteriae bacterium]|nr:response regulator transcription factor [Ignavibacteriota bacterium]
MKLHSQQRTYHSPVTTDESPISIILADDHPVLRKGMLDILRSESSVRVIAETGNGDDALRLIESEKPNIAILDVEMPKKSGIEVAKSVQEQGLPTDVIILTLYDSENFFNQSLDVGVMGYVLKDSAVEDILECIQSVMEGKHYISPQLSNFLLRRRNRSSAGIEKKLGIDALTTMERKILKHISENKTTKIIAEELFLSPKTIDTHRHNICTKLEITGTNALLRFALEHRDKL